MLTRVVLHSASHSDGTSYFILAAGIVTITFGRMALDGRIVAEANIGASEAWNHRHIMD